MPHYAVTAIGADRPGIVATLTRALFDLGANLEDVSSTILRGHFAIMLVADASAVSQIDDLVRPLSRVMAPLDVAVSVRAVEEGSPTRARATHRLTVYGSDRPGIVAELTERLASLGVNITDLSCRLTDAESPVYVTLAELELPPGLDQATVSAELRGVAEVLGVDVSFHPIEVETL
jgi:glycine cleavage system transcriptional repressor